MKTKIFLRLLFLYTVGIMNTFNAIAQEKSSFRIKNTTLEYLINKNTQNADLEEIKKEINSEKIAELEFSKIERNKKGEIISISTKFKDDKGSSQVSAQYNSLGISPFSIIMHEKENGDKYLEIKHSKQGSFFDLGDLIWSDNFFKPLELLENEDQEDLFDEYILKSKQQIKKFREEIQKEQENFLKRFQQHKNEKKKYKKETKKI